MNSDLATTINTRATIFCAPTMCQTLHRHDMMFVFVKIYGREDCYPAAENKETNSEMLSDFLKATH